MLAEMTLVPGSALPVERLAEHLRLSRGFINDGDLDVQLQSCIRASVTAIEARTGKAVFRRRFAQTVTQWSTAERHVFPIAPVASVEVVRIVDRIGVVRVLEPATYALVTDMHCPGLAPTSVSLPLLGAGGSAEIEFLAGYSETWDGVPADLAQAVLMLAGTFFGQDEDVAAGFPPRAMALIEPYRTLRLRGAGA